MDLLNKLGSKQPNQAAAGSASAEPINTQPKNEPSRGANMIDDVKGSGSVPSADAQTSASAARAEEPNSTNVDSGDSNTSDGWTTDSALKEVKKLREENKQYRLKYVEQIDKIKQEQDLRLQAKEQEMADLLEAKKELDKVKAEQEDKKRDLSEKLIHRESKISELETVMSLREKEWQKQQQELARKLEQYEIERQAEAKIYQDRVKEELDKVPEKYRDYAQLIVKGAGDARDALLAISEAKIKGMFEEKTVVVNHSVPGAQDGARSSNERISEAQKAQRDKMTSHDKIKEALKSMKSGTPNSAFRTK